MSSCAVSRNASVTPEIDYGTYSLGVSLSLFASVGINFGNNVQALGLQRLAAADDPATQRKWKRVWLIGTVTFICSALLNFVAFAFGPASVLATLEAVQFLSNIIFGKFVFGHTITRKMQAGSVLSALGVGVTVGFGPAEVFKFTTADLVCFWQFVPWIVYVVFANAAAISLLVYWHYCDAATKRGMPWRYSAILMPVVYAVASALVGSQSTVQAKSLSELVSLLIEGNKDHIEREWISYFAIVFFLLPTAFWLYRLNDALSKYNTLFIIPLMQASYVLFGFTANALYFQEFSTFVWWQFLAFFSGIGLLVAGLVLLVPANPGLEPPKPTMPAEPVMTPVSTTTDGKSHADLQVVQAL